jgi:hypothetical protein
VPGCTVDQCFAGRPTYQRTAYDALIAHLSTLGPFHADAVSVGVFLKAERKFAEIRPKARSLSLELALPRPVHHPRISRRIRMSGELTAHFVKLTRPDEVDAEVLAWLTEAYDAASG